MAPSNAEFQVIDWHAQDARLDEDSYGREFVIKMFGVDKDGVNYAVNVTGFRPRFFLLLPEDRADLANNAPDGVRALLGDVYGKLEAICGDASLSLVERYCSICGHALTTFREGSDGPTCLDPLSCDKATL